MRCVICGIELPSTWDYDQLDPLCLACELEKQEPKKDPDYCGLGWITLGKYDPLWQSCRDYHDPIFDDLLIGKISKSQLGTLAGFGKSLGKKWLQAAYTLVAAPLYFVFGGVLGMVRYRQLIKKGMVKEDSSSGEMF